MMKKIMISVHSILSFRYLAAHETLLPVYADLLRLCVGSDRKIRRMEGRLARSQANSALPSVFAPQSL